MASRDQLHRLGFTDASIANAVEAGRLHRLFRGVFAVGHPGIGRNGLSLAAVLACGDGAAVSHGTAAALLGLWDRPPVLIDVIARRQAGRKIDGIRIHQVPLPSHGELTMRHSVVCTTAGRTLVDLAGTASEGTLRRTVERAAVLGLLDVASTEAALGSGRRRGAPALRTILEVWRDEPDRAQPRLRSELEARVLALIRSHGIPAPLSNRVVEAQDKRFEVDFLWPEQRLVLEVDGHRFHSNRLSFERDRQRDRNLMLCGYAVLRITRTQTRKEAAAVMAAIRRLLEDRANDGRAEPAGSRC